MIHIESDLPISMQPIDPAFDLLEKDSSHAKLFAQIARCLENNGITSGYRLGGLGSHEEYSIFKDAGYWVVAFSERGMHDIVGIFPDFHDATEMLLCKMLDSNDKYFDWKEVFS